MAQQKPRKSAQVAMGGIAAGLAVLMMFLTGVIPFAYYALPAMAGLVLIAVQVELGAKTALIVYAAVSLLSVFVVPDKEAAILFIMFFGYYPILRPTLMRVRPKVLSLLLRFVVFNAAVLAAYWIVVNLLGMTEILDEFGNFGKYSVVVLWVLGNVFFLAYDYCVGNISYAYVNWFRLKFLGKK